MGEHKEDLAEVFCQIPQLEELDLSEWNNDAPEEVFAACSRIPRLQKLTLRHWNAEFLADVDRMASDLGQMKSLRVLDLSHSCLADLFAAVDPKVFLEMPYLRELDLEISDWNLCQEEALLEVFSQMPQLKILKNTVTVTADIGMAGVLKMLRQIAHTKNVSLEFTKDCVVKQEELADLVTVLSGMRNLTSLRLSFALPFSAEEAALLAGGLGQLSKLRTLTLRGANLGAAPDALAEALSTMHFLKLLDLVNNQIGDQGAQALAEVLRGRLSVQLLFLARNTIGDIGVRALAKVLPSLTYLASIKLSGNPYKQEGAESLEKAFKQMLFLKLDSA